MSNKIVVNPEELGLFYIPDKLLFREEEYSHLLDNIKDSIHTVVWGPIGSGKTMLLRKASAHTNSAKIRTVYVDCSLYGTANAVLREILIDHPIASRSNYDLLKRLMERARNNRYAACLDHVENLRDKELIGRLVKAGVSVIISCTNFERLSDLDQISRASITSAIQLDAYSSNQAYQILKSRVERSLESGSFSNEIISKIASKTAGNISAALNILKSVALKAESQNKESIDEKLLDAMLIDIDCSDEMNPDEKLLLKILQEWKSLPASKLHDLYTQGSRYRKSERSYRNYLESLCSKGLVKAVGQKRGRVYEIIEEEEPDERTGKPDRNSEKGSG